MSAVTSTAAVETTTVAVCRLDQLVPERGVAALVDGEQIALFRVDDDVFAIAHRDPFTGSNVLARGIVGTAAGRWYVASPLHKQRFALTTGQCLDDDGVCIRTYPVHVVDGLVHIAVG
jgi:nitrite reductase (NADH) small subunit